MSTDNKNTGRVELPAVVPANPDQHISMLLVEDGLAQALDQLNGIEQGIAEINASAAQLNERMTMLQSRKIAATAQRNLLTELKNKITEFGGAGPGMQSTSVAELVTE